VGRSGDAPDVARSPRQRKPSLGQHAASGPRQAAGQRETARLPKTAGPGCPVPWSQADGAEVANVGRCRGDAHRRSRGQSGCQRAGSARGQILIALLIAQVLPSVPVLSFALLWRYGRQTKTPARADGCRAADIARAGEPAQDRAGPGPAGARRADVRGREDQRRGGRRVADHPGDGRQVAQSVHQAAVRRAERRAPARRAAHDRRREDRGGGGADPGGGARGGPRTGPSGNWPGRPGSRRPRSTGSGGPSGSNPGWWRSSSCPPTRS
jgi:hypothetical protein